MVSERFQRPRRAKAVDEADWRRFRGPRGRGADPALKPAAVGDAPSGFAIHLAPDPAPDTLRGRFLLRDVWRIGVERVELGHGDAPWNWEGASLHFRDRLHRFGWLPALLSQGRDGAARAAMLVDDWIGAFGRYDSFAWRTGPTADRVWTWMRASQALCVANDVGPESALGARLVTLDRQVRYLKAAEDALSEPKEMWRAACVELAASLCLQNGEGYEAALDRMEDQCGLQILLDGGHASRSPQRLLHALLDLQALDDLIARSGREAPPWLERKMAVMGAMLAFMRAGDGRLYPFNDGGEDREEAVDAALAALKRPPRNFSSAPKSGFQKVKRGQATLVLDAGAAPEAPFGELAHCGALGIEFSDGPARLITSCGFSAEMDLDWQAAVRRSRAHSTLIVEGLDNTPFEPREDTGLFAPEGPPGIFAKPRSMGDDVWLDAQHSGYKERFHLLHRRSLHLDGTGRHLRGEDALFLPVGAQPVNLRPASRLINFELRFHLHPSVTAMPRGDAIELRHDNGAIWRFRTTLSGATTERSAYIAAGGLEETEQIVLRAKAERAGDGSEPPNAVRWALVKEN